MRKFSILFAAVAPLCIAVASAQAISTLEGSSSGIFGNPTPKISGNIITGQGTNELTFGPRSTPNTLRVDGETFSTLANSSFSIGTVTIIDGVTPALKTTIPLTLNVNFTTPSGVNLTVPLSTDFTATSNNRHAPANADLYQIATTSKTFTADGQTFSLQLQGFGSGTGNAFSSQLIVPEGTTAQGLIFAQVITNGSGSSPVPELSSATLLALGIAALVFRTARK